MTTETTNEARPADRLVTLPCNGAWQPVFPKFQHGTNEGHFTAKASRFVVDSAGTHHGDWWNRDDARRFAASMGGRVRGVPVYWYVPAFGCVEITQANEPRLSVDNSGDGHEHETTLASFLADNKETLDSIAHVSPLCGLKIGETFRADEGAGGTWSARRIA